MSFWTFTRRVAGFYSRFKLPILAVFLLMCGHISVGFLNNRLIGRVFDYARASNWHDGVKTIVILALVSLFGMFLFFLRENVENKKIDFAVPREVALKTMRRLFEFSVGQHTSQNSGINRSVVSAGEHSLQTLVRTVVYEIAPIMIMIVVAGVMLLIFAPEIGVVYFGGVTLYASCSYLYNKRSVQGLKTLHKLRIATGRSYSGWLEHLVFVSIVGQEKRAVAEHDGEIGKFSEFGTNFWGRYLKVYYLVHTIVPLTRYSMLALVFYRVTADHRYTLGDMFTFWMWAGMGLDRLSQVSDIQRNVAQLWTAIIRYFELIDIEPDVVNPPNPIQTTRLNGQIAFEDVVFAYPKRKAKGIEDGGKGEDKDASVPLEVPTGSELTKGALRGVSFILEPGKRYALVGPSGSGKSTAIALIGRAFDPQSGKVMINDHDLRALDYRQVRARIGLVPQMPAILDETLKYNLTFCLNGKAEQVTREELDAVCRAARVDHFFPRLEKGYDTLLGERGVKLSGGERQRIAIARALMQNPDVLIFDEATSNLDTESEAIIRNAIAEASKGRTTIVIAHRLATVVDADEILVLDEGKLVGRGTHDELLKTNEVYGRLVSKQVFA